MTMLDRRVLGKVSACFLLTAACVFVWHQSLDVPFVYDDFVHLVPDRDGGISNALKSGYQETRPLFNAVVYAVKKVAGTQPWAFHLVSLSLHCLATLLAFFLARRVFPNGALLAAALFCVHPLQAESVCYANSMSGLLAGMFFMAALVSCANLDSEERHAARRSAAWLFSVLAMLSKESAVVLPAAALLLDWSHAGTFQDETMRFLKLHLHRRWELWATALIVPVALFLAFHNPHKGMAGFGVTDPWTYFLTQLVTVPWFARLWLFPLGQSIIHQPEFRLSLWGWPLLGLSGMACVAACAAAARKKASVIAFGVFFFFVTIAPTNSIYPLRDFASERFMYLPSFGLSLLLAYLLLEIGRKAGQVEPRFGRVVAAALPLVVVALYSAAGFARVQVWKDPVRLWSEAVLAAPSSVRARTNLARALGRRGMYKEAIEVLDPAVSNAPKEPGPRLNRAAARLLAGDATGAMDDYMAVASMYPTSPDPWMGLARAALAAGDLETARLAAERLQRLSPGHPVAESVLSKIRKAEERESMEH